MCYLSANQAAFIGGTATITEVMIIISNYRKRKKQLDKEVSLMNAGKGKPLSMFLWSANPINLFRR